MTTMNNPAAAQGWVKSTDPKTGRVFYANHVTRKTQWEAPPGWVDTIDPKGHVDVDDENEPLPSNWERLIDPTTGKAFYVDHERKITQWTRPTATSSTTHSQQPLRPAVSDHSQQRLATTATSPYSYQQPQHHQRTYFQEAQYYHSVPKTDVDWSDSLPSLEFQVKTVPDAYRNQCPHCQELFTAVTKRRHHCRLCGDVFCDACSNHRCELPLSGTEFEKPVRVCDFCYTDVQTGNFFSIRRYLTPLDLYPPASSSIPSEDEVGGVATHTNVNAALSALASDLDAYVQAGERLDEKITIPPPVLIPKILKHLGTIDTADRAMKCLAALVALENMTGKSNAEYTVAIWTLGGKATIQHILDILERNSNDRKTLYVQEQAARVLFYLTEPKMIANVVRATSSSSYSSDTNNTTPLSTVEEALPDLLRMLRVLLDHASTTSTTMNPNLQRWAAATLQNLIAEDQRRACDAINEMAARIASGQSPKQHFYETQLPELVQSGGVMILGSLIASEDADTRAHAVNALSAILVSTRAVDAAQQALAEMTGGEYGRNNTKNNNDTTTESMIRAIVAAGGCSGSVAQLVLSAENNVAGMGCQFLNALVQPLLSTVTGTLPRQYDYRDTDDHNNHILLGSCREAAIEISTGSCLPALLSLVRASNRPMELRRIAMETLAATVSSTGEMGRSWAAGQYEEGLERYGAPSKLKEAIVLLNEEGVMETALEILQSASFGQSLGSSDAKETPASRMRECAGILLSALTSCSAEAIMNLQSKNVLATLLVSSTDPTMTVPSTLRGDESPRCLGVLETVAALLMFAWQHPSGSSKDLLDTLIEMMDAGVIPYASKVLNAPLDWDRGDKAVGGMKGRAAACRLLCCLFGIALTDATGIGMRRLMDAVDADARAYSNNNRRMGNNDTKRRGPTNIVEAALTVLQTSSYYAQKVLVGGASANQQGAQYQSTLMDLVESSLLAAGSLCGSSIAPGGSEGTMITGENFLTSRTDPYVQRREQICSVTCDVIVRGGGRSGSSALLPTMMVGGFGEGSVMASLRLSLAIAQNGTKEQHSKLAVSGVLVPISDLLRSALTQGDIYKFSSALALVRFCGPYVAAGHGGGLESVRDAIRVATNVLTLPVNPGATLKQMETQESLKSECIAALESLSRNASLWSSISTEALPSIVRYLHSTTAGGAASANPGVHATKCAALRAILQIVQVPSHAVSAAEAGIVEPLGKLLTSKRDGGEEDEVPMLALEVLHVIAANAQARQKARFLESGLVRAICASIGNAASDSAKQPTDPKADVAYLGLDILHSVLQDVEGGNVPMQQVLESARAAAFLDSIASESGFVRAMCATLLVSTSMKLTRHDADSSGEPDFDVPKIYGPGILLVPEKCGGGYDNTHDAAEALLFTVAVYACAVDSERSDFFWNTVLLQNLSGTADPKECQRAAATFCAQFLSLLTKEHKAFIPINPARHGDFLSITRPLVRYRLLDALKDCIGELSGGNGYGPNVDPYVTSLIVAFNIPHICLTLWRDPALLDVAFELIKHIVEQDPDEVLHLFVEGKDAIMSLFDLLNLDSTAEYATNVSEIRSFLASILGQLAENGLLADAVEKYGVRSSAIAALAAACLSEEERPPNEDEDTTSNKLSTVLMRCLVDLCKVKNENGKNGSGIRLSSAEAKAIATNLGKKICHMVLSRFLERSKLQQYEMEHDEDITDAPDVAMLCAVAQHDEALTVLRSIGGLHALSLVAAEGEISAILALKKACSGDANILLEGDTYLSMMSLIASDDHDAEWRAESPTWYDLETSAFDLLSRLCSGSKNGRKAVVAADTCHHCVTRAMDIISSMANLPKKTEETEAQLSVVSDESNNEMDTDQTNELDDAPPSYDAVANNVPEHAIITTKFELGVAACSFLSSLAREQIVLDSVSSSSDFVVALSHHTRDFSSQAMQFASLNLISSLAPYVSNESALTANDVFAATKVILDAESKHPKSGSKATNEMLYVAVRGLDIVIDCLNFDQQKQEAALIASLFVKSVKKCVVVRSAKDEDREFSAELTNVLTKCLLHFRGKEYMKDIFNKDVIGAMMHLVQWKQDPKTVVTNPRIWDAAVSNCLLLMDMLFWSPNEIIGIDLAALAGSTLMLARPGKAPRKAIDVNSALRRIVDGPDASAALSAQRILDCLFH